LFCKIVKGKVPTVKVWEDENFLAFLDMFPNTEGMTLVIPKKHFNSDVFELSNLVYEGLMEASRKVAKLLVKGFKVKRVSFVMEGMGVNHMHVKLYPLHGLKDKFTEIWVKEKVYFDKYPGYLTTLTGPEKSIEEREKVAKKIRKAI